MPQKYTPRYSAEFKAQMVELVRAGREPKDLAREFEPSAQSIRHWAAQADRDQGKRRDGLSTDEREELRRLRRENKILQQEKEILKKAGLDAIGHRNTTELGVPNDRRHHSTQN